MGIFWLVFGSIIVVATFFVRATPQVPLARGVATNLVAGFLLLAAGGFSIIRGRRGREKGERNRTPKS